MIELLLKARTGLGLGERAGAQCNTPEKAWPGLSPFRRRLHARLKQGRIVFPVFGIR